ncbi:hypothetical protein V1387_02855 [Allomuricauda taeanensis]|uniref:hypothetical protein n=1 Tax=Flagellimonas taeanensis TaxID=1005926 RepID=UPI002E7AC6DE|nr:hypothetical protein [Allomuricauda taeanensis]MEE1961609.1 hypothetical protein [Allomuricauda taeanensis]
MSKNNITYILLAMFFLSCGLSTKNGNETNETIKENMVLFDNGFNFTDSIRISKIELNKVKEKHFKLFFFLEEKSNFNELQKLNIAFRVYPKNPDEFHEEKDRQAKAKTIGTKCKIQLLEDHLVIESDEFVLYPTEFSQVKVFLYDPSEGVMGKMMTILNLDFQKAD